MTVVYDCNYSNTNGRVNRVFILTFKNGATNSFDFIQSFLFDIIFNWTQLFISVDMT